MRRICAALGNLLIVISIVGVVLVALGGTTAVFVGRLELGPTWQTVQTAQAPAQRNAALETTQADAPPAAPRPLSELHTAVEYDHNNGQVDDRAFAELNATTPMAVMPAPTASAVAGSAAPSGVKSSSTENRLTAALETPPHAELQEVTSTSSENRLTPT